jgi:hypothetical protein
MKKRLGISAITMVIAGLLIASVTSVPANLENNSANVAKPANFEVSYLDTDVTQLCTAQKNSNMGMSRDSFIIYDTEVDDFHPTVAGDANDLFVAAFETEIESEMYPWFLYSLDGETWDECGYFGTSLGAMFPDVDANANGHYGTFGIPPEDNYGAQWLVIAEDPLAITGATWDWSAYNFDDFNSMSISCHSQEDNWNYGGMASTGYNGYSGDINGCPFIYYPTSETGGTIGWLNGPTGHLNADFAIDEETGMSYAVYDHETDANLMVRKDNFGIYDGDGHHPYIGNYYVGDDVTKISRPSVEAHDDTVVIVAEVDGGVDCFYSSNGGTTTFQSDVADSATYPEVISTWDGDIFVCSYVKDGAVYRQISEDGGATWSDEQQIQDSDTTSDEEPHDLGKSLGGVFSVWEDDRGSDIDIYFGSALEVTSPELSIESIKGGIGVKATIKNIGDAPATNVVASMTVKGGLLGMINKDKNVTETSLAVGDEFNINSGLIIGIGKITVEVAATCDEGSSDSETKTGRQILFFSMV